MRMLQFVVGFISAAIVAVPTVVWFRSRKRQKILNSHLSTDSLLSVDRAQREDHFPSPEDIKYFAKVKDRMNLGKGCLHPPLYQGGSSGEDEV